MRSRLAIFILVPWLLMGGGCGLPPKRHNAPDRTKFQAAAMRVEKAIPVVKATHAQLARKIASVTARHEAAKQAHAAEGAVITAIEPRTAKLTALANTPDPTALTMTEMQDMLGILGSDVSRLHSLHAETATILSGETAELAEIRELQRQHGAAIEEVNAAKNEAQAEGAKLFGEFDRIVVTANRLELELASVKGDLLKLQLRDGAVLTIGGLGFFAGIVMFVMRFFK